MATLDVTTPTVRVLFPNGGESFKTGDTVTIRWTSSDNVGVTAHDIKFSATGDAPFTDIVTGLPGTQQSYDWMVPSQPTTQGVIRVVARDAAGNQSGDRSDATFTITAAAVDTTPPTVSVSSPANGDKLTPGLTTTIRWTSSDNVGVTAHDVKFSATGAEPFTDIATGLPGSQMSYSWMVPNQPTTQGAIRVVARDAAGNQGGAKSGLFTIAQAADTIAPTVTVSSPANGDKLTPGLTTTIRWTSSDNVGVTAHDVKFSATGAEPFTDIATGLPGSQMSYSWMVPNQPTTQGAIRVVARDAAGNQGGAKSGLFTIAQPTAQAPMISQVSPPAGPASRNGGPAQVVQVLGMFFQTGARVFFGMNEARVTATSDKSLSVEVPESTKTGPVAVKVTNPDGQTTSKDAAFNYLSAQKVDAARIFSVKPLTVLENAETNFEITGRNLATAYAQGVVAIRVPKGVTVEMKSDITVTPNAAAQQDTLAFRAIVHTPSPLNPLDRLLLTVVASVRANAVVDHIHESSRATFTVVGAASPIPIAFSAQVKKGGPNVVVVAGRGLANADVTVEHNLGDAVQVSKQRGDDELAGVLVTVAPDAPDGPLSLVVRNPAGQEVGRYPVTMAAATAAKTTAMIVGTDPEHDPRVANLSQVPGQRLLGPSKGNIQLFDLRRKTLGDGTPNLDKTTNSNLNPGIKIDEVDVSATIPIVDLVRLFPLFDEGGAAIDENVFTGTVGAVLGLRALSLVLVVQVSLKVS
ncbi:MAG TPA: Ig-like domain-containing protein, partial [Acidimicrobiales bacterium]|nr:Ig-like domain-containing protein [Acidimicrobiales bacterium]